MKTVEYQIGQNTVIIHQPSTDEELRKRIEPALIRFIQRVEREKENERKTNG